MKMKQNYKPHKPAPHHIQAYQSFRRQIKKESERFRDTTQPPPKHPPLVIGGRLYKYRTHALRDLSITDEELALMVEWTDANPTTRVSKTCKNIHKWSTFHYRTAWKHPNAGPKTFAALQRSVYWPARSVGYTHHKWLRSKEAFVVSLSAMVQEKVKRARNYMRRAFSQRDRAIEMCKKEYDVGWMEHTLLGGPAPSMNTIVERRIYELTWFAGTCVEKYLREKPWEENPLQESGEWSEGCVSDKDAKQMKSLVNIMEHSIPF